MVNNNENIKKICSFYVSNWHLVTMLLPHINKKINEEVKITTVLEESIERKMTTLLGKLRIENKEKILQINWKNKDIENLDVKKLLENCKNIEIIVNGSIEYINNANKKIVDYIQKNTVNQEKTITIVDCYDCEKYESKIKDILKEYSTILNTAGEHDKNSYITSFEIAK